MIAVSGMFWTDKLAGRRLAPHAFDGYKGPALFPFDHMNSPSGRIADPSMFEGTKGLTGTTPGTFPGINNQGFDHNELSSRHFI
jgi:hypothetical protein